jgi:hypothetical protein
MACEFLLAPTAYVVACREPVTGRGASIDRQVVA